MTLSIICPIYNEEKYLKQCIDSVLSQSLEDIELILVNDGSTDSSGDICDKYALIDSRIKVIHQTNQGVSVAREKGLMASEGEYIGFVDGDDYVAPEIYERLVNLLIGHNADMSICDYFTFEEPILTNETPLEAIDSTYNIYYLEERLGEKVYKPTYSIVLWNKIYKRNLFNKVDYSQYKSIAPYHYFDDIVITQMLMHESEKIIRTSEKLYFYRQMREGLGKTTKIEHAASKFNGFKIRHYFLKNNGYDELYDKYIVSYGNMLMLEWVKTDNSFVIEDFKQIYKDLLMRGRCNFVHKLSHTIFRVNPRMWQRIATSLRFVNANGEPLRRNRCI